MGKFDGIKKAIEEAEKNELDESYIDKGKVATCRAIAKMLREEFNDNASVILPQLVRIEL